MSATVITHETPAVATPAAPALPIDQVATWKAAMAAYRSAVADADASGGGDEATDREVAAQEAVLLTPAPDLEAVSVKLSFIGEFNQVAQGDFLTPEIARRMVERGNSWTDRCLAAAYLDLERLADRSPADPAWDAAVAALKFAADEEDRLMSALEAASLAAAEDAPVPDILKRSDGSHYNTEAQINQADIPFDQKATMVAALREWEPVRTAATAAHQLRERNEEWSAHSVTPAEDAVIRTPAPHAAGLAFKLGLTLSRKIGIAFEDLQTVDGLSQALTEPDEADLAVAYQDALRLAGERPDLVAVQAFDVEGWITAFEAHPGHMVGAEGRLSYLEPKAYGADTPAYEDITVTEPDAIARFNAYQRRHYTDEQWEANKAERKKMGWRDLEEGVPFIVQDLSQLDAAYPAGGPEYDRLRALWDLRRDRLKNGAPTGAHLWRDLAPWQRHAVRDFCRAWPTQFIDNYRWTPERWMKAFEAAGGSFQQLEDGDFFAGSAFPPSFFADRLMRALDGEMRAGLGDILRAKSERQVKDLINEAGARQ